MEHVQKSPSILERTSPRTNIILTVVKSESVRSRENLMSGDHDDAHGCIRDIENGKVLQGVFVNSLFGPTQLRRFRAFPVQADDHLYLFAQVLHFLYVKSDSVVEN